MATKTKKAALIDAYATNNRINVYLVENLPDEAWRAKLPTQRAAISRRWWRTSTMSG